jgi:hypothetical protein
VCGCARVCVCVCVCKSGSMCTRAPTRVRSKCACLSVGGQGRAHMREKERERETRGVYFSMFTMLDWKRWRARERDSETKDGQHREGLRLGFHRRSGVPGCVDAKIKGRADNQAMTNHCGTFWGKQVWSSRNERWNIIKLQPTEIETDIGDDSRFSQQHQRHACCTAEHTVVKTVHSL